MIDLDQLNEIGGLAVQRILAFAAWLTGEGTPGLVSLALVFALVLFLVWYGSVTVRFIRAVNAARSIFSGRPDASAKLTRDRFIDLDTRFGVLGRRGGFRRRLADAWNEFKETTVQPESVDDVLRNTVRPNAFFNREDLGLEAGIWRQIPAWFVSIGLFLTFLGLVAALDQTGRVLESAASTAASGETGGTASSLRTLLQVASAKFIMSLTGLFCSIVFMVALRLSAKYKDGALHRLCRTIEDGCDFLSEQVLLGEMLKHSEEQTKNLQTFSTELVAQIAQPLREELPTAIREGIRDVMAPAVKNLSQDTGRGIESMAGAVSERLAEGIRESAEAINEAIGSAAQRLEAVSDRLDGASSAMGGQMNETLQSIRNASTQGARDIVNASETIVQAAKDLSDSLKEGLTASARASGGEIERAGREMASGIGRATAEMRSSLLDPMNTLNDEVQKLAQGVETATGKVGQYSDSVETSAINIMSANDALEQSAATLANATAPVRDAVTGIERASRDMGDRVDAASKALVAGAHRTTEHMVAVIDSVRGTIESSQSTVKEGLGSLGDAVKEFREIIERYREIDQGLGAAFQRIQEDVQSSIDAMDKFRNDLNDEFARALNRLEAVIAQVEPFTPREE